MAVTVITVAYHSLAVLPAMVDSLPPGVALVIVDNGDDGDLHDWAAARGITLRQAPDNPGFGAGCNLGAAGAETGFLLFLNPDTVLLPGSLAALLAAAGRHPGAAAFGPLLVNDRGEAGFKRRTALAPLERFAPSGIPAEDTAVPVLDGAALLVRRQAFEAVGGFDPALRLYYEDDDLSLRLRAKVGPLMLVPQARVRHQPGHSSPRSPALARQRGYHLTRSYIHAARKHGLPLAGLLGWLNALSFLVSKGARRSATGWAHARGRLAGAWSMRNGGR